MPKPEEGALEYESDVRVLSSTSDRDKRHGKVGMSFGDKLQRRG